MGIDSFIVGWPEAHITAPAEDGSPAGQTGIRIVPGTGPKPSWIPQFGDDFHDIMRCAHQCWAALHTAGIDVVIDHVLLDSTLRDDARNTLNDAFWVGVMCDTDELIRREIARGDRFLGFASGSSTIVHSGMTYDFVVDATSTPASELASQIHAAVVHASNAGR